MTASTEPAPRTVAELRALLSGLSDDTLVLTSGYEGAYSRIGEVSVRQVREYDRGEDVFWLGRFDDPTHPTWDGAHTPQPVAVGDPLQAVILHRENKPADE